jgi:hypothetical protein
MKAPKPAIPRGAPPGTVWYGGPIEWSCITLRIRGDELDPEEITRFLGCRPDLAHRKGDPILRPDGTVARVARTGAWHLEFAPEQTDEWDCGEAMLLLLQRLPADVGVWRWLTERFAVDLYVSLTMRSCSKGFSLTPEAMSYLGVRGIEAGFDVLHDEEPEVEPVAAPNGGPAAPVGSSGVAQGPPSGS